MLVLNYFFSSTVNTTKLLTRFMLTGAAESMTTTVANATLATITAPIDAAIARGGIAAALELGTVCHIGTGTINKDPAMMSLVTKRPQKTDKISYFTGMQGLRPLPREPDTLSLRKNVYQTALRTTYAAQSGFKGCWTTKDSCKGPST